MFSPLLTTKFYLPVPRPDLVTRPRLLKALDDGLFHENNFARKLTLVSAAAGYGKTTLIADWLFQMLPTGHHEKIIQPQASSPKKNVPPSLQPVRAAWLSLDESDNDPARFLAYFITALRQVEDRIGKTALSSLQSPQPPAAEIVLTSLINDIAVAAAQTIMVVDDYHVIHTPAIHRMLAFFLDHLPVNLHLVLLSREDPLLPVARLRARGQMLELRQVDLRFTIEESADFLERVMGLSLSSAEIAALEHRTEGWIAGLQLAALSMRGRNDLSGFIQAFTGSSRFILDYLIEEVFEHQPAEVKDFLLKTSILEQLSAPLCDSVAGKSNSQALLESLEQANLFIVPIDQSRLWYRYHRLFSELLRHRLRISNPNLVAELHQKASRWFEDQGLVDEAIQHALSGQDWRRAGNLIQGACDDFLKRGEVLTVIGWFQALPEELLLSDPKLCFDYCWPLLLADQYETVAPWLERLEQISSEMPAFRGEIYAAQAYLARCVGDQKRMVERSQWALQLLPKDSVNSRGIVAMNLGLAYWHQGDMRAAEAILSEAIEATRASGNHYAVLTSMIFLGRVLAVRGELHQAAQAFLHAIQQGGEMPINTLAHMDMAILHYEWNELTKSDAHLKKAIAIAKRSQNDEFLTGCWLIESRLRIAQNDFNRAGEALEQAQALAQAEKIPVRMIERVNAAQAYFLVKSGAPLRDWGTRLNELVDSHPFYRFLGVTKTWTLPEADARTYLEKLSQQAQANGWVYGLVVARALQASLAKSPASALDYLAEALQSGEAGGFIRSFVEVGAPLIPLLRLSIERGVMPVYAHRLLDVIVESAGNTSAGLPGMPEPLSERELEVLRLVAAGLSNREIAGKLFISTGTAKTHVHNLCGKLGVSSRTQAAVKAKELGLA